MKAFGTVGYQCCEFDVAFQSEYEKIAVYCKAGVPTHAAKQRSDGRWISKLGIWEDIEHSLEELTGLGPNEYGTVAQILRRPRLPTP